MDNFQKLFEQVKIEMSNQTKEIIAQLDDKLAPFTWELQQLRSENDVLRKKVYYLEKQTRSNNIILYGIRESEDSSKKLMELVKKY